MDQLISQKVNVIIAYPVTEAGLTQGVAAAKAAGIPVVPISVPSNSQKTLDPNVSTMVGMAFDQYDYVTMKHIAEKYPKGKVAFLGFGPPTENLMHHHRPRRNTGQDNSASIFSVRSMPWTPAPMRRVLPPRR